METPLPTIAPRPCHEQPNAGTVFSGDHSGSLTSEAQPTAGRWWCVRIHTHGLATAQITGSQLQLLKGQLPQVQLRVVTAYASGKRTGDWPAHLPSDQDPLLMFTQ